MADINHRKGSVRSQQNYMQQQQTVASSQEYLLYQQQMQAQQNPYQYQQYQNQKQQQQQNKFPGFHVNRNGGYRSANTTTARFGTPKTAVSGSKMGIKSGMTVEDLKRLTQKRMQQSGTSNPGTPKTTGTEDFASSRPATPKLNMAVVNAISAPAGVATPPAVPKTGMSVQELKQLTALRVASQNAPVQASEVTGLVSKAVLNNAAKSRYRDIIRNSLTPGNTPKRAHHTQSNSSTQYSGFGNDLGRSHGPSDLRISHDTMSLGSGKATRGHRSRLRSCQLPSVDLSADNTSMHYSYTGGQTPEDYFSSYDFGGADSGNSTSSQETDTGRGSLDDGIHSARNSFVQISQESFPPPPPMDESGGFVSTALPSWSPPPNRTKKLNASASSGATFYNQQTSYYNIASRDESAPTSDSIFSMSQAQDQHSVLAPPPGLTRRSSMTVPWQVAEAVLMTPQTNAGRKKLDVDIENSMGGLNSSAAEAAAQLTGLSIQSSTRSRGSTGVQAPPLSSSATLSSSPSNASGMSQLGGISAVRRGSFGNAAEFFKFRRRSKSRLELARDLSFSDNGEMGGYSIHTTAGAMPGIAERHGDADGAIHEDSDASSSVSAKDESSSQDYTDEDLVHVTGGYEDTAEIPGSFVSFYNASRQQHGGLTVLSIPPPPPPMTDDDDDASTTSSAKGSVLPMMSPNGARLRKVAELARQGSLSSEDKTRAKDEIIQSSLGIGANSAARLLATKKEDRGDRVPAMSSSSVTVPPGFPGMPRLTPKACTKKKLARGPGIVRSNAVERLSSSGTSAGAGAAVAALDASTVSSGHSATSQQASFLEERLSAAAQKVADCVGKSDMTGFQHAMDELDWLRNEASKIMRG